VGGIGFFFSKKTGASFFEGQLFFEGQHPKKQGQAFLKGKIVFFDSLINLVDKRFLKQGWMFHSKKQ